ncbi:Gamma-tubulin complex component 4 [Trichinella patagoniensis]|uniref:Gamma-tubulin complex component 4 n=1 Tax=Trichinella patagoniensis TaxID=990121 RepID=A0A0V1AAA7_9BILA|nr:Gamma-tubulin complex component 4 [Trichinella patagoniensis]
MTTQGIQILVVELTKNLRCLTALGKDMFTGGFPVSEALMPVVMEKFPHLKLQRTWHLKSQQMTTICENSWRREKFRRIHSSHCAEGRLGEPEKRRKGRVFLKMSTHPKRSNEVRITSPGICHQELAVPSLDLVVSFPSLAEPLCLTGLYESLRLVIGSGCIGSERRMRRVDFQLGDESISDQPVPWRRVMQELLLALLGLGNKNLWESLKACDVLNPAEREIVDFLNGIGQKYAQIRHFIREQDRLNSEMINKGNSTPMRNTYLVEIAAGLSHTLLKPYEDRICLADKRFSEEPTWKLIRLHSWFYEYNWIFEVVVTLCKSFSELYGGKVFFLLKDALETCPDGLTSCLENLISRCQMVLYRQIMSWLVHDLLPPNDDFFIQRRGGKSNSVNDCEIIESFLPLYIDLTTANQILCIGVKNKLMLDCFEESGEERNLKLSQFNAKRNIYADKLKQIFVQRTFPQIEMSLLIDSWHKDITEQLWNQALQGQSFLSIFREINKFYFLGNGALFQYFIDLAEEQLPKTVGELGIVDSLNAVFRVAQGSFDCRSDVERVRLKLRAGASEDQSLFSAVELSLDLGRNKIFAHVFSSSFFSRCNDVFRFLLKIRYAQFTVNRCWFLFIKSRQSSPTLSKKQKLMSCMNFIMNNLQCYFQIDVLETLRRGFLLAVQQNCDIHRLPLLLEQFMDMLEKALMIRMADLCDLIDRLLLICECFCRCSKNADADENDDAERVHNTYISLERCMMTLYRILANPKTRQAYPLFSQLLLKLDMNNYFSNSNAIKYAKEEFMQSPKQKCQAKCHGKRIATFAITLCKPNVSSQTRSIMKAESIVSKTEVRRAKLHVMIDQLTQLCKDAPHPDDLRELLDDVMAFHDKTLEMQLQLEAALTGEERDQEAKHWAALSERTQIARREARARIRQMEGPLSDCSASSNDLGHHSNSKTSVRERLPELKMPALSRKGRVVATSRLSRLDPFMDEEGFLRCYVCLFTCMASRAVHLELVPQMTTARVMQALRRFIARRGRPETIQSDNFRSFKAAASELRQLWRHVDVDRVQRELVGHRIHWKFITERAPWMGGYWERLVRSIKESLRKILGKALLDEEELRTTLCEVEASLNARPLTFVGEEDHERHPLSPFQLLTGRAYVDFPAIEAHDPEWQPTRISVGTDAATEMEIFPSGARSERFGADPGGQHPASPVPNRRDYGIALGQRWHREIGQDPDVDQRDHAASGEARPTRTDNCQ